MAKHMKPAMFRSVAFLATMLLAVMAACDGSSSVGNLDNRGRLTLQQVQMGRLVDVYAKRPQVQERLTTQVADSLMSLLDARGVIVVIEAEHLCMTMRGVRKAGARTITSAVRGQMHNAATRSEAMALIHRRP